MKRLCLSMGFALSLLSLASVVSAATQIQNITMTGPLTPNSTVTICFQAQNTGGGNMRIGVGFGPDAWTYSCANARKLNWVLFDGGGVYRGGNLTVGGAPVATTSQGYTDVLGLRNPGAGTSIGSSVTWTDVCFDTTIPPEFSGDYTLAVFSIDDATNGKVWKGPGAGDCYQGCQGTGAIVTSPFTVTGTPLNRLNFQICDDAADGGCIPGAVCFRIKITNWGESAVRLAGFSFRFCFFDTETCWESDVAAQFYTYTPDSSQFCNNITGSGDAVSWETFTTVNCGQDGMANRCLVYTFGDTVSDSWAYHIPPNGGWMENDPAGIPNRFRKCDASAQDTSDDYASLIGAPACSGLPGSAWSERQRVALYFEGDMVCEWESSSSTDPDTGVPHCGSASGCDQCATGGNVSNKARSDFGSSNAVCFEVVSPTPTPMMEVTKTSSVTTATIGDTVTFCMTWHNDSSSTVNMVVWDTVPGILIYTAADNGGTESGDVVTWNLGNQGPGTQGTVCFWGVVSSYPWWPIQNEMFAVGEEVQQDYWPGFNSWRWTRADSEPRSSLPRWIYQRDEFVLSGGVLVR